MTIVDKLMKADMKKANELNEGIYMSKKLAKILGEKDAVEIKLKEIHSRRINDLSAYQLDKKGNVDYSKAYDAKLMMCVEGIVEPNLKDKDLQAHFGAKSANDLCEKLFGFEINYIADEITKLSDILFDGADEEIKN